MLCALLLSSCRHLVASKIEKGEKCHDNTGYNTVTVRLYFRIIRNFLTLNKTKLHKQGHPRKLFSSTPSFSKHLCFCVLILLVDLHLMLLGVLLFSAWGSIKQWRHSYLWLKLCYSLISTHFSFFGAHRLGSSSGNLPSFGKTVVVYEHQPPGSNSDVSLRNRTP